MHIVDPKFEEKEVMMGKKWTQSLREDEWFRFFRKEYIYSCLALWKENKLLRKRLNNYYKYFFFKQESYDDIIESKNYISSPLLKLFANPFNFGFKILKIFIINLLQGFFAIFVWGNFSNIEVSLCKLEKLNNRIKHVSKSNNCENYISIF